MCKNNKQSQNLKQPVKESKVIVRDSKSGVFVNPASKSKADISKLSEKSRVPNGSVTNRNK